jgi:RimJ/RimL family protein N-acetyltransferase
MFPDLFRDEVFRIETPRLWLRWPRAEDAPALQAAVSVADVAVMTASWPHPLPEGEASRRIERMRSSNAGGQALVLAIARTAEPLRLIGTLGLHDMGEARAGLGYLLDVPFHGRGLMTEAVEGLVAAAFTYTGCRRIEASSRIINPASARVLDKCGFTHKGAVLQDAPTRGGPIEVDLFELTRAAWRARIAWARKRSAGAPIEAAVP